MILGQKPFRAMKLISLGLNSISRGLMSEHDDSFPLREG